MESIQDINKRGNVEGKVKFIIQRTIILLVAIMVSATFFACGKTNGDDDDNGNGGGGNSTFQLKIFQGYDIPNKRVVDYGNNPDLVDFKFYVLARYNIYGSYLGDYNYFNATKIKEFENIPTGITAAQVDEWENWTISPLPGNYYIIRARDGRHFLIQYVKIENAGMDRAYWLLTFDWKEISVK